MHARVIAILVARSGAAFLPRTLQALAAQSRPPEIVVAVDAGSADSSAELLAASGPTFFVQANGRSTFGAAVSRALQAAAPAESENEWLWLLAHDNAPSPNALAELLGAVEIAPSVAIAGPKLMRWDQPDVIAGFGESLTGFGASVALVEGELDQAQHDVQDDVLGVAQSGMLVRRSLWNLLGGFDPGLASVDAALDFSVRARLAGFRVVVVPGAKVASAGGPELFGRRSVSDRRRIRLRRAAQLHRRLVYAPAAAVPLHWLSLVPLGVARAVGQLLAKRPGAVTGEISTAFGAAFSGAVGAARRNLKRTSRLGWPSIAPLRMQAREVRERRAQAREAVISAGLPPARERAGFISHGGLWVVVLAALVGVAALGPLLGTPALTGGGLLPLSASPAQLWANVGYGWRDIGGGFTGAADPFAYLLAVLGSLTFWSPSSSIVLLYFLALPLAALGAWFAARRLSDRLWLPAVAALLWALAPPLAGSLSGGHLGAVIGHLLLPWLLLAGLLAARSWAASAAAALLFAAVAASAPILVPAMVLGWLALVFSRPAGVLRLIGIPIPALVLFIPLAIQQIGRGNPLGLLAEPGVPVAGEEVSGLHLALLAPGAGLHGWTAALISVGLPGSAAIFVVAALLAPVAALALLALFVPGSRRAIPSLALALLGFLTAIAASHVEVSAAGGVATPVWAGPALSLFWLGLIGGVLVALDAVGRIAIPFAVVAALTTAILVLPMLLSLQLGTSAVEASGGRMLPAVVTAEASSNSGVGTLVLTPQPNGGLATSVQRGDGTALDEQSTLAATSLALTAADRRIATLAGNLASRSGFDSRAALDAEGIEFIVLADSSDAGPVRQRVADALDGNSALDTVGPTANGLLWRIDDAAAVESPVREGNADTALGRGVLIAQAVIFALTLLLGIPTVRRRRRVAVSGAAASEPASTFEEEEDG